jgi:membrane associated rhomboid family serine protease
MRSILEEVKSFFKDGSSLNRIIFINVVFFILLKLFKTTVFLIHGSTGLEEVVVKFLAVPADLGTLGAHPWTVLTYMFVHADFFHILFNMIWLYWMGRILIDYVGSNRITALYVYGGIAGAVLYFVAFNLLPVFSGISGGSYAIGASAGVLAVTFGAATLLPDYRINLLLIGPVALKYLAAVSILIDLISISSSNAGGHIAHIGGAFLGYVFISFWKKGTDLSKPLVKLLDLIKNIFSTKKKVRVVYRNKSRNDDDYNKIRLEQQELIDSILDKISESGYDSLTKEEKEILFKMSGNTKKN